MQRIFNPVIETMSREQLEALQRRRLAALIQRAYEGSSFWRTKLQRAGVQPDRIRSADDLRHRVPCTNKDELLADQIQTPPHGDRLLVDTSQLAFSALTSGTSGKGQEVHGRTFGDLDSLASSWATSLFWAGVRPGQVAFHMLPVGVTAGPVSMLFGFHNYGMQVFLVGGLEGNARLEMMQRFKPHFFAVSPLYLRRLTVLCEEMGIDPRRDFPELTAIKIGTFGYEVEWAREMEDFWGCRLAETYASTQSGAGIGATCECGVYLPDGRRSMMHFLEHKVLMEVIDRDSGKHVEDGEEGELVVTTLDRAASPVIRFATGDRVVYRPAGYCSCGRPFAGIEAGTVARYDSMMKVRGMNFWPEAVDRIVFSHPEIAEYNGRVRLAESGREVVEVLVEFNPTVSSDREVQSKLLRSLELSIKDLTNVSVTVADAGVTGVQQISYKEKRWKDLRK